MDITLGRPRADDGHESNSCPAIHGAGGLFCDTGPFTADAGALGRSEATVLIAAHDGHGILNR